MKTVYFLLLFAIMVACSKETETKPELTIETSLGIVSAKIYWKNVFGAGDSVLYEIYLNRKLEFSAVNVYEFEFLGLAEKTAYSGSIVATNFTTQQKVESSFEFTTKINSAPLPFEITINALFGNGINISWSRSSDPDGGPVLYDVFMANQLLAENLSTSEYSFTSALPETAYTLTIVAKDKLNKQIQVSVNFTTLKQGAQLLHITEYFQGLERSYNLYKPANTIGEKIPLIMFLHGYGGVVWPEMITSSFLKIAEEGKFNLLMPQAFSVSPNLPAWDSYAMRWDDAAFLSNLLDLMVNEHQVDKERIYVSGFSNGGFMTYFLAKKFENRIAAIAPIAGLIDNYSFPSYSLQKPMPLCYIHGTADSTVQVFSTSTHTGFDKILKFWIQNNHITSEPVVTELENIAPYDNSTVTKFEYIANLGSGGIVYYRINGGNHSIPGTRAWSNFDINAYQVMWDFFKTRRLSDK